MYDSDIWIRKPHPSACDEGVVCEHLLHVRVWLVAMKGVLFGWLILLLMSANEVSASDDFFGPFDPTGIGGATCACPGTSVQYLCTVTDPTGGLSQTIWRGTAFECTSLSNQIVLVHSQYVSGPAAGACNDGEFDLTAQGLTNVTDNCYTSVLTVNIEPGLNERTVECTFAATRIVGSDTLDVAVPLSPPSSPAVVIANQSFTITWAPPTNECGNAITYMYPGLDGTCGQCTGRNDTPSVTCSGWTPEGQSCSIIARADNCDGQPGNLSEPVVVNFAIPATPAIIGGDVVFDQSQRMATVTVQWEPVDQTANISLSGAQVLVDGSIRDYLVSFTGPGPGVDVSLREVTCSDTTCTSPELPIGLPVGRANFVIRVVARNAIAEGAAGQARCGPSIEVSRSTGSSLIDVTLTCPVEPCTIRYGTDPTYQVLPFEGTSGEQLQNLTGGETYYTEASFTCGSVQFTVRVQDSFDTCECPTSGLFAGAVTQPATCTQPYTGGVHTNTSNGIFCYDGLNKNSTAVFMCEEENAVCTGSCEAVCECPEGETEGQWSASFENVTCRIRAPPGIVGLDEGQMTGIGIGAIAAGVVVVGIVIIVVAVVIIVVACFRRNKRRKASRGIVTDSRSFTSKEEEEPPEEPLVPVGVYYALGVGCALLVPVAGVLIAAVIGGIYYYRHKVDDDDDAKARQSIELQHR